MIFFFRFYIVWSLFEFISIEWTVSFSHEFHFVVLLFWWKSIFPVHQNIVFMYFISHEKYMVVNTYPFIIQLFLKNLMHSSFRHCNEILSFAWFDFRIRKNLYKPWRGYKARTFNIGITKFASTINDKIKIKITTTTNGILCSVIIKIKSIKTEKKEK